MNKKNWEKLKGFVSLDCVANTKHLSAFTRADLEKFIRGGSKPTFYSSTYITEGKGGLYLQPGSHQV